MTDTLQELRDKVAARLADDDEKRPRFDAELPLPLSHDQMTVITGILNYVLAILDALIQADKADG